jgi:hypothetical protein
MSVRGSSTALAFRIKSTGVACFLLCFFTLALTGCMHKTPLDKRVFTLTGSAEFPIMAPQTPPAAPGSDFQESRLELAGKKAPANPPRAVDCTVKGNVFSLAPASASDPRLWVVTSPNVQGWQRRSDSIDAQAEWIRFAHQVLALERSGCFPKGESTQVILRQIAEAIPLPASEELFFSYSLGRSGFVDLVPGMQLVIERAAFQNSAGVRVPISATDQFSETLAVVARHPAGSRFRLLGIESRGLGKTLDQEADSPRSVPRRFASSSLLRLMLLTLRDDNTRRYPVLLGATNSFEIWNASDKIVDGTLTECPPPSSSGLECLFLGKDSAVSVLMSIWVNGRHTYNSVGATVGSLLGRLPDSERNSALAAVSLERPLVGGGYARVNFPHDLEGARNVILLNGDRLAWQH